jgi:dihydroxyacid dehydratase/phosphogluconate dehydratase
MEQGIEIGCGSKGAAVRQRSSDRQLKAVDGPDLDVTGDDILVLHCDGPQGAGLTDWLRPSGTITMDVPAAGFMCDRDPPLDFVQT